MGPVHDAAAHPIRASPSTQAHAQECAAGEHFEGDHERVWAGPSGGGKHTVLEFLDEDAKNDGAMMCRNASGHRLLTLVTLTSLLTLVLGLAGCTSSPDDGSSSGRDGTNGGGAPLHPERPGCAGNAYAETLPTNASLDGLSFSAASSQQYLLDALDLRFPLGKFIVSEGLTSPYAPTQKNCFEQYFTEVSSAPKVLLQASQIVHECGHYLDLGKAKDPTSVYVIREDLSFSCEQGDTTDRKGMTFARSRIRKDAYATKRRTCGADETAKGCDFYADIYLNGDPDDAKFESGDQGYNLLLEEASQYVNSLATALAFEDAHKRGSRITERDGILTFLWYIERYLKLAKESYPDTYAFIHSNACWRQVTLTIWDRAWFYLNATKTMSELGLDAEIDALRALECQ